MASAQQFSLRWNNYLSHITGAFDSLRADEHLVDVTLSCEGKKIKAHKMLLSACSAYFRDIFRENPCQHPVVIFRNVKYADLEALVTFMYQGEVNVEQEGLSSFLNTAELLEIQGLTGGSSDEVDTKSDEVQALVRSREKPVRRPNLSANVPSPLPKIVGSRQSNPTKRESLSSDTDSVVSLDGRLVQQFKVEPDFYADDSPETYDRANSSAEILPEESAVRKSYSNDNSMEALSNFDSGQGPSSNTVFQDSLQVFGNSPWRRSGVHPLTRRFCCDDCGKVFKHPRSLDHHRKMHEGRTTCPACGKVFGRMYALRLHVSNAHPELHRQRLEQSVVPLVVANAK